MQNGSGHEERIAFGVYAIVRDATARRIAQLQDHHRERLEEILLAARDHALSAADTLPILFKRQLDTHQMTFAMGEALAHLHYLWMELKLERFLDQAGVQRFRPPNGG